MLVVDASVLVRVLADDGVDGRLARARVRRRRLVAPEVVDLEVLSTLRGLIRAQKLPIARASRALLDLEALSMARHSHVPFLDRCWQLRNNVTPYDASYVALAEALDVPLLTADARLAAATGPRCRFEILG